MNQIIAKQLANNWMSAWNKHDVSKLAEFYDEDCELSIAQWFSFIYH